MISKRGLICRCFSVRNNVFTLSVSPYGRLSFMVGMVYLILKLCYWDRFNAGTAPLLIGIFFIGSILLFFMGLMGEYIMSINQRVMNRPLVIEEERINFEKPNEK